MLLVLATTSFAATTDLGVWTSVFVQGDLAPEADHGPRLWLDLHGRRTDQSFTGIVRPAVGWDLAEGVSLFVGWAWVPQVGEATDDQLVSEQRVWEQALITRKAGEVTLVLRPRLEQRFLEGQGEVGHRARLWGRAGIPVVSDLSLSITEEIFVGLNETEGTPSGVDQNRVFVGPALPVSDLGRVEVGYTNQYLLRDTGDTSIHVVAANLFLNF